MESKISSLNIIVIKYEKMRPEKCNVSLKTKKWVNWWKSYFDIYSYSLPNRKMFCLYKITIWNEFSFALFLKYLVRISMICINTTLNILFKATITNFLTYPHTIISELADIITTVEGQKPQEGCKKSAQQQPITFLLFLH